MSAAGAGGGAGGRDGGRGGGKPSPGRGEQGPWRRRRPRGADRGPRPIGDTLGDVVQGLLPPGPARTAAPSVAVWGTVFSRWEEVVGPGVAGHTRPLRLESGVLVVAVDQPAWATQVRSLGPEILGKLQGLTGEQLERLDVVVRRL
jgi:predicted nucleic acid-binding Zn ribbon protein